MQWGLAVLCPACLLFSPWCCGDAPRLPSLARRRCEWQMSAQLHLLLFQPLKALSDRGNGPEKTVRSYGSFQEVFSVLFL